ncbi:MAG TPA: VWA domain-containing protein [Vicinamibacteria bacterium]|nr:VWA domain-containing protein [Vicinamibacteria bacterium]
MLAGLAALLLQAAAPALVTRTVDVVVTDAGGRPVQDLTSDELALVENGVVRDIVRIAPDERPLSVAVLVDSSEEISSIYRLYLVDAVATLVKTLPRGARYGIWVTGDRPRKLVDLTEDRGAAVALKRVVPSGGNTLLDALVEVTTELHKKREGERLAVVAVTGMTTEFSSRDRFRVVEECQQRADLYLFFSFDEGGASLENRTSYDYVMSHLARKPGGRHERSITAMAAPKIVPGFAEDLAPGLRLSYETPPGLKERKVEVQVSRPGLRARALPGR